MKSNCKKSGSDEPKEKQMYYRLYIVLLLTLLMVSPIFGQNDIEQNFCGSSVLVVMDQVAGGINKIHEKSFFGEIEIKSIKDLSYINGDISAIKMNFEDFHQTLLLTLPVDDKENVLNVIEQLSQIEGIKTAEPNYFHEYLRIPNDPYYQQGYLWGLNRIVSRDAWDITIGEYDVKIGIIDSGVNNHNDLNSNLITGWDFVNNNSITNDDLVNHGTHVAGTVAAVGDNGQGVVGVNWRAKIVPLQVDRHGSAIVSAGVEAIYYAMNNDIPVLNYSIGYRTGNDALYYAIKTYQGLFVCAAGNYNMDNDRNDFFPASYRLPNLISVGSVDQRDDKSSFSNYGIQNVDIYAPGSDIMSTNNSNGYQQMSGTSMASPHVAGVAGLLIALDSSLTGNVNLTGAMLKRMIVNYSDRININTGAGSQYVTRLNAYTPLRLFNDRHNIISVDTVITNQTLNWREFVIVNPGVTLTIENSTITTNGYGIILKDHALLEIINSTVTITNGILSSMSNGEITMTPATGVGRQTKLTISKSDLQLKNSKMTLNGGVQIVIEDGSRWRHYDLVEIIGNNRNNDIYVHDSYTNFEYVNDRMQTIVRSGAGGNWGDITFKNCIALSPTYDDWSYIRGDFSGISKLYIVQSNIVIQDAKMYNSGNLSISDNSSVFLNRTKYYNNSNAISVLGSSINTDGLIVTDNYGSGLLLNNSPRMIRLANTQITNNRVDGLQLSNTSPNIQEINSSIVNISGNIYTNITASGTGRSLITSRAMINDSGAEEIYGTQTSFPYFILMGSNDFSEVVDSAINPGVPNDRYLLMSPASTTYINVGTLRIDSNPARYYPNYGVYFINHRNTSASIYTEAMISTAEERFEIALDTMKNIIDNYPESPEAELAVSSLPYIIAKLNGDFDGLFSYLNQIHHEPLLFIALEAKGLTKLFNQEYHQAIELFNEMIAHASESYIIRQAELNQAYCYLMLRNSDTIELPENIRLKPETMDEYLSMLNDMFSELKGTHEDEPVEISSDKISFSTSNYPNPFNPETSISFTLPTQSEVSLEIYNIKGQKVKSLVKEIKGKGSHQVVWNGTDENNRHVSSGIYFYNLQAGEHKTTKKIILMK